MEKHWERTLPFIEIDYNSIYKLFKDIVEIDDIDSVKRVNEGCRTSNYIVKCKNNIQYLLKITNTNEQILKSEINLIELVKNVIPVQKIYKVSKDKEIQYTIYEYIDGETISSYVNKGNMLTDSIIKSVAVSLGKLHNIKFNEVGFFNENLDIHKKGIPILDYYKLCINDIVEERLGKERIENIFKIINNNIEELMKLDKEPRLVHGDFQGTNILIKNNLVNGIIDWEFSMSGHPIADIGQFFRYDEYFNDNLINIFKDEYNKVSEYKLSENWYKIGKIRDLINLIKLIDTEQYMPNKHKKIKQIIDKIIRNYA